MEALGRMPFTAQKEIFKQLEEYADSHRLTKKEWEAYENRKAFEITTGGKRK